MSDILAFPSFTKTWHNTIYPRIDPTKDSSISAVGKNVVISGGGSGIGAEIARTFAAAGAAHIAIFGRTEKTLARTLNLVKEEYPKTKVSYFTVDMTDEISVCKLAQHIKQELGTWDVLVANAGYSPHLANVQHSKTDDWFRGFEVNVKGNFLIARELVPLAASIGAVLIHVSTGACHTTPITGYSAYSAAKLASTRIFEHVQVECPHLRVTSVHPGVIMTDMTKRMPTLIKALPQDDISLAAGFIVWVASKNAEFARGRMLWSNWDVDELVARGKEIASTHLLTTSMEGWATYFPDVDSEEYKLILEGFGSHA